jgi:iduronate 2-sulfatase
MTGRRPHHTNVLGSDTGDDFRKSGIDSNGNGSKWITMPEHFKVHQFTTLGGGKTFHPNHPKNFDYPTSWSTDMPYFDFDYWLPKADTKVSYSGACPGPGKPNSTTGLAGPIAVWCALDEPDDHFYDYGLANNMITRLHYAVRSRERVVVHTPSLFMCHLGAALCILVFVLMLYP